MIFVILTFTGLWSYLSVFHQVFPSPKTVIEFRDPPRCNDLNSTNTDSVSVSYVNSCVKEHKPPYSEATSLP